MLANIGEALSGGGQTDRLFTVSRKIDAQPVLQKIHDPEATGITMVDMTSDDVRVLAGGMIAVVARRLGAPGTGRQAKKQD
ncbi:hypothetical protein ASD39_14595 [Sphingomonas sp. Root50]|nr:hypothetical protein ASD17_11400 [Sphingomonas sp. Root1294]KQY65366.1 hypothetical protein ASD39_14595 [Sphingomonas sp. Root50]KRB95340.1 hypothetical protein ASE22_05460 [Sphingomonas sp. Root720]